MPAGDLKMPDPIVEPTSTAVALHNPNRRVSCRAGARTVSRASVDASPTGAAGETGAVIVLCYCRESPRTTSAGYHATYERYIFR
jgi:hypothetical protein